MAAFCRHFGRTFTPAENQRFSPGTPTLPQPKLGDFRPGPRLYPSRKSEIFGWGPRHSLRSALMRSPRYVIEGALSPYTPLKARECPRGLPLDPCEGVTPSRSRVAIRAVSSPYAAPLRSARLPHGRSFSRRENAKTFASLLVPMELSRNSLIFTPCGGGIIPPHPHTIAGREITSCSA